MKKTTLTISFDEEKLSAMKMYLEQKQQTIEGELEKSLDALYAPSPLSVVGGATPEEKPHD